MASSTVGFFVMPPGHGKSYYHDVNKGIIEADTLVPHDSTEELRLLRPLSKDPIFWNEYDKVWSAFLNCRLRSFPGRVVVLVPSRDVGLMGGWVDLGGATLALPVLMQNVSGRKDDYAKHERCRVREKGFGLPEFQTNQELEKQLRSTCKMWIEKGESHPSKMPFVIV
jgi:hypothetical protein